MTRPFYIVDAFTNKPFQGNPAAVVPLENWLPEELLQKIACQNNLSETCFLVKSHKEHVDFEIRWFTPLVEVPLCGHATLAAGHVIFSHLLFPRDKLVLSTKQRGVLSVSRSGENIYTLRLQAIEQCNIPIDDKVSSLLNLSILEAYSGEFTVFVLPDAQAVEKYVPNFSILKEFGREVVITSRGNSIGFQRVDFVSRMFAPTIGINEDPFTGAAHAQLAPYWSLVLQKTELRAAQIGRRKGFVDVSLQGSNVALTGSARTYVVGELFV